MRSGPQLLADHKPLPVALLLAAAFVPKNVPAVAFGVEASSMSRSATQHDFTRLFLCKIASRQGRVHEMAKHSVCAASSNAVFPQ